MESERDKNDGGNWYKQCSYVALFNQHCHQRSRVPDGLWEDEHLATVGGAERHDRMLSKHLQTCTYKAAKIVTLRISLLPAFQPTLLALPMKP